MKINTSYVVAGALLLVIGIWFALPKSYDSSKAAASNTSSKSTQDILPTVVIRYRSAQEHADTLTLYGRTEPARQVNVSARTAGVVIAAPSREGRKVAKGAVLCRQDVDARQAMLDQAKANFRATEVDLNAARVLAEKGFQSATRVTAIEAQMDGASAAIKQAEIELENVITRAPFPGVLERQIAEVGDYLTPGQACGLLVELNPLIIAAELTEAQLSKVARGQTAEIFLATGQTANGVVKLIEAMANPNTRTFRAEISVPNSDYSLKAGVTADVRIASGSVNAHNIPSQILALDDIGTTGVRFLNTDNTVGFAPVTTIDEDENGLWVTGLPDETRIIVKGQDYVAIGSKVDPVVEGSEHAN